MDEYIKTQLHYLGCRYTLENWNTIFKEAKREQPSYQSFLTKRVKPNKRHKSFIDPYGTLS